MMKRALGLVCAFAAGCVAPQGDSAPAANAIQIGALLPFTGEQAAVGTSVERMLMLVQESVNAAGGVFAGRPMALRLRDTHSDVALGRAEADTLLGEPELVALLGPEEPELAEDLVPSIAAKNIPVLLPGASIPDAAFLDGHWHSIGPPLPGIASALGKRAHDDGARRLAVLVGNDDYSKLLGDAVACEFGRAGGLDARVTQLPDLTLDPTGGDRLRDVIASAPDAVMIAAYPRTAATVVRSWALFAPVKPWYLAPTLDSDELVSNVLPGTLEGAVGIAAALRFYAGDASRVYQERWHDFPPTSAYYYYDAAAVLALAIAAASNGGSDTPPTAAIEQALRSVSSPPGEVIAWNDLAHGLELAAAGVDIDYDGLSGGVDLAASGSVAQSLLRFWSVAEEQVKYSALPLDYASSSHSNCVR